jgi:hypothetical protein
VAAAPITVNSAPQADGTHLYQFTVMLPAAWAAASPQQRLRRLSGGSGGDPFSAMMTDGTLAQKLLESGVGNVQDLINSGCALPRQRAPTNSHIRLTCIRPPSPPLIPPPPPQCTEHGGRYGGALTLALGF